MPVRKGELRRLSVRRFTDQRAGTGADSRAFQHAIARHGSCASTHNSTNGTAFTCGFAFVLISFITDPL